MDTVDQTVESGQRETFPISGTRADNTSSTSFEREPFRNIKIKNIVINHHRLADAITGGEPATGKQKEAHLDVNRLTIKFNKTFFLNEASNRATLCQKFPISATWLMRLRRFNTSRSTISRLFSLARNEGRGRKIYRRS